MDRCVILLVRQEGSKTAPYIPMYVRTRCQTLNSGPANVEVHIIHLQDAHHAPLPAFSATSQYEAARVDKRHKRPLFPCWSHEAALREDTRKEEEEARDQSAYYGYSRHASKAPP